MGQIKPGTPHLQRRLFSNVRNDADPEGVYAVASAIKDIMETQTREVFVNVSSILNNN